MRAFHADASQPTIDLPESETGQRLHLGEGAKHDRSSRSNGVDTNAPRQTEREPGRASVSLREHADLRDLGEEAQGFVLFALALHATAGFETFCTPGHRGGSLLRRFLHAVDQAHPSDTPVDSKQPEQPE